MCKLSPGCVYKHERVFIYMREVQVCRVMCLFTRACANLHSDMRVHKIIVTILTRVCQSHVADADVKSHEFKFRDPDVCMRIRRFEENRMRLNCRRGL